ncbi:hypothetical protein CDD83_3249 [Cordyceps sp. RAO-2017]|nr:hypothetical protein CDD83_3249 [Cordyceps sp. RAO-2017]
MPAVRPNVSLPRASTAPASMYLVSAPQPASLHVICGTDAPRRPASRPPATFLSLDPSASVSDGSKYKYWSSSARPTTRPCRSVLAASLIASPFDDQQTRHRHRHRVHCLEPRRRFPSAAAAASASIGLSRPRPPATHTRKKENCQPCSSASAQARSSARRPRRPAAAPRTAAAPWTRRRAAPRRTSPAAR